MKETVTKKINEVESVSLLYPEYMHPNAAETIQALQEEVWALEDDIHTHRSAIHNLEKTLNTKKEVLQKLLNVATINYKTVSKEVTVNTCTFGIRGHGNDIIGRTSKV